MFTQKMQHQVRRSANVLCVKELPGSNEGAVCSTVTNSEFGMSKQAKGAAVSATVTNSEFGMSKQANVLETAEQ